MALPTLVKTWQFNVNQAILAQGSVQATHRRVLRSIKNAMIGFPTNPWTVAYSCNSVTAGAAGDGVDRWLADANIVGASGVGGTRSWIVLQQNGINTGFQLLIDCWGSGTDGTDLYEVKFYISPSVGFSGGSTTSAPTAADQWTVTPGTGTRWISTGDVASRLNVWQSSDGQSTRVTYYSASVQNFTWWFEKPANPTTGWTPPLLVYISGPALSTIANLCTSAPIRMRHGGVTGDVNLGVETGTAGVIFPSSTSGAAANDISAEWAMLPVGFSSGTATMRGRHGNINDMWLGSTALADGDTFPADGSRQFVIFGDVIYPWNGGAVNLA